MHLTISDTTHTLYIFFLSLHTNSTTYAVLRRYYYSSFSDSISSFLRLLFKYKFSIQIQMLSYHYFFCRSMSRRKRLTHSIQYLALRLTIFLFSPIAISTGNWMGNKKNSMAHRGKIPEKHFNYLKNIFSDNYYERTSKETNNKTGLSTKQPFWCITIIIVYI